MKRFLLLWAISLSCLAQEQVWVVNQNNGSVAPKSFEQAVAEGLVDGYSYVQKFGQNLALTDATEPEDLWNYGGIYTNSTTANIGQMSSSSASDTGDIVVEGVGATTNLVTQTVTMNGTNSVSLATNMLYVFRMYNNNSSDLVGTVYASTNGTALTAGVPAASGVRAIIDNGDNQTLMAVYLVPAGKTAYLTSWGTKIIRSTGANAYASFSLRAKRPGKVFRIQDNIDCLTGGSSAVVTKFPVPLVYPEGTEIRVRVDDVSANMGASGGFSLLLKDN